MNYAGTLTEGVFSGNSTLRPDRKLLPLSALIILSGHYIQIHTLFVVQMKLGFSESTEHHWTFYFMPAVKLSVYLHDINTLINIRYRIRATHHFEPFKHIQYTKSMAISTVQKINNITIKERALQ